MDISKLKLAIVAFIVLSVIMPLTCIAGLNFILEQANANQIHYNFWSWFGVWLIMLSAKSSVSFK